MPTDKSERNDEKLWTLVKDVCNRCWNELTPYHPASEREIYDVIAGWQAHAESVAPDAKEMLRAIDKIEQCGGLISTQEKLLDKLRRYFISSQPQTEKQTPFSKGIGLAAITPEGADALDAQNIRPDRAESLSGATESDQAMRERLQNTWGKVSREEGAQAHEEWKYRIVGEVKEMQLSPGKWIAAEATDCEMFLWQKLVEQAGTGDQPKYPGPNLPPNDNNMPLPDNNLPEAVPERIHSANEALRNFERDMGRKMSPAEANLYIYGFDDGRYWAGTGDATGKEKCECWLCRTPGITCETCESCIAQAQAKGKCGEPAASFIPRWGMSFACALPKGHTGDHQQGGKCFAHGEYIGTKCPQWPSCVNNVPLNRDAD